MFDRSKIKSANRKYGGLRYETMIALRGANRLHLQKTSAAGREGLRYRARPPLAAKFHGRVYRKWALETIPSCELSKRPTEGFAALQRKVCPGVLATQSRRCKARWQGELAAKFSRRFMRARRAALHGARSAPRAHRPDQS